MDLGRITSYGTKCVQYFNNNDKIQLDSHQTIMIFTSITRRDYKNDMPMIYLASQVEAQNEAAESTLGLRKQVEL